MPDSQGLDEEFPIVMGLTQMMEEWWVDLPVPFNRRVEDGGLVLWRPGFTIWAEAWCGLEGDSSRDRLNWLKVETSPLAYDTREERDPAGLLRYSYRLDESAGDARVPAFYGNVVGPEGDHVILGIYFDDEADVESAHLIFASIRLFRGGSAP